MLTADTMYNRHYVKSIAYALRTNTDTAYKRGYFTFNRHVVQLTACEPDTIITNTMFNRHYVQPILHPNNTRYN